MLFENFCGTLLIESVRICVITRVNETKTFIELNIRSYIFRSSIQETKHDWRLPLFFRGSGLWGQRLNERHFELRSSLLLLVVSESDPESSACWFNWGVEGQDIDRVSLPARPRPWGLPLAAAGGDAWHCDRYLCRAKRLSISLCAGGSSWIDRKKLFTS